MAFRATYSILLQARTAALVAICVLASSELYCIDKPITVALVFDGLTQEDREPLRAYLTKAMGQRVNIAVPDSYNETVAHLADASYDFACLGALMYVRSHATYGVIPLVQRTSDLHFHALFITGPNSPIHSLRDLMGKQFAFGDIGAAGAHLIAYHELVQAGINPETDLKYRYSGSHPATAAMVEAGVVDAGVLDETLFDSLTRNGKLDNKRVRVFYTSKPYVGYVFVARRDVPEAVRERFVRALLALKEGNNDPVLNILRAKQFVVANDQEYTAIRRIAKELKMF
jgi:phosphonate transport system substrate-binding protein